MSNLNRHPVRRAAAGILAGTLTLTGAALAAGASPASAQAGFDFDRLSGPNRYATAADIALDNPVFQQSDTVILASGESDDPATGKRSNFPDALTGNYLAGKLRAPILLTRTASLPEGAGETKFALEQLRPTNVIIVGGTSAVSLNVENRVKALGFTVTRLGGLDRYDTAELVAKETADANNDGTVSGSDTGTVGLDPQGRRTAILGNGQDFPDILAGGAISYAEDFPLTITRPTALPAQTRRTLESLDVDRVIVVGGSNAVSETVATEVRALNGGTTVDRISGADRYQTAVAVANFAYDQLGFDASHVNLARGDDFADALTGGPHAGEDRAPIVLTAARTAAGTPAPLNAATRAFLVARACGLRDGHIFGGFAAVPQGAETEAETAARDTSSCPQNAPATPTSTIDVRPDEAATFTATVANPATGSDNTSADDRVFFIDGLTAGQTFRITLVRCENVQGQNRDAQFLAANDPNSSTGFSANTGNPTADITRINGVAISDSDTPTAGLQASTATFIADEATATFVVDGDAANECVVPVVYFDSSTANASQGGDSTRLEVEAPATAGDFTRPVEVFDTGGQTTFRA